MSIKYTLNQDLNSGKDQNPPDEKNDGTIGGFYAELKGGKEPVELPVEARPALMEVLEFAQKPGDGLQPMIPGDGMDWVPLTDGPTKSIDSDNLEELMSHLNRDGESWLFTTLKVAFPQSLNDLPDALREDVENPQADGLNPFQAFNSDQISNTIKALNQWSDVSNVDFVLAGPEEQANIYFMGREYPESASLSGQSTGVEEDGSLIKMNTASTKWGSFDPGTPGFVTMMHEIGHSIGLNHPGDYDAGDNAEYETHAEYIQDSDQFSIMSYFGTHETGASYSFEHIFTPRTHDIWVTQKLYGAEWSTRTDNTTYGYNATPDVQGTAFEFWPNGDAPHLTIWDAGGNDDTLDLSLDSSPVILNLNPGTFSSTHGAVMNISLAHGPDEATPLGKNYLIENAIGGFGDDLLVGNSADNELNGTLGNDILIGGAGADTLLGGWGDDILRGGFGTDYFDGDDGFDIVEFTHSNADWNIDLNSGTASNNVGAEELDNIEGIVGSNGDDVIVGDGEDNLLDGRDGNDTIEGLSGDDTLKGGRGHDQMFGGFGTNDLDGGDGVDTLFYKFATGHWDVDMLTGIATNTYGDIDNFVNFEKVIGSNDSDVIRGDHSANVLLGDDGDDDIHGRGGIDHLHGEEGDDTLTGGSGDDIIIGGEGSDTASFLFAAGAVTVDLDIADAQDTGGDGVDTVQEVENAIGSSWADSLHGTDEANRLEGRSGNDQLFGREGNDTLNGDFGDDTLEGGLGDDFLSGGQGRDAASYYFSTEGVLVSLGAEGAFNTFGAGEDTYSSIEDIIGSFFGDALYGNDENNRIFAGDGDDVLVGNAGIDDLFGGAGDDTLIGGTSHDYKDGGAGIDWAYYDGAGDLTVDLADTDAQWTGAGTDKLVNIENLRGWTGDDDLRGDAGDNEILGMAGNDTLYGGTGEDTLEGGEGNDKIYVGMDKPFDLTDDIQDLETNNGNHGELPPGRFDLGDVQVASFAGLSDDKFIFANPSPTVTATVKTANGKLLPGVGNDGRGGIAPVIGDKEGQPAGSGADVVVFRGNWGDDEVFDFYAGSDKLDFSSVIGVDEVLDLAIADTDDGVLIEHGENSVLLHDVEQASLDASDFWF